MSIIKICKKQTKEKMLGKGQCTTGLLHTSRGGLEHKEKLTTGRLEAWQTHLSLIVTASAAVPIRLWNKQRPLWQMTPCELLCGPLLLFLPLSLPVSQLDQSIISGIATGLPEASNKSLIRKWCQTFTNTVRPQSFQLHAKKCSHRLQGQNPDGQTVSVLLRP